MNQTPSLAQLIKQAIGNRLIDMHTAIIGRIEKYDAKTQLADIHPILKRSIKNPHSDIKQEELPILVDVPVLFPRAGGYFISLPIKPGDYVQVIFNETSIDEFMTGSAPSLDSVSRFSLQGAVAIAGVYPQSQTLRDAHENNLVLGKDAAVQIHIDGDKIRMGSADASEALAIASKVKAELDAIKSAFRSHTHASRNTPTVTQVASTGDIATTKVTAI